MRGGPPLRIPKNEGGFTLIEVVVVITIIAIGFLLGGLSLGTFSYFGREAFFRQLLTTIEFLHHQAISDQAFYRLEFDFDNRSYRVGAVRPDDVTNEALAQSAELSVGTLTLELADFLNPPSGDADTLIPPPSFPSLAEPHVFPKDVILEQVKTSQEVKAAAQGGRTSLLFSPRGFSEFGVLHFRLEGDLQWTILINPFSGTPVLYREFKDFEWTYGNRGAQR
jgi:prepilin-type N-terminal cleavage/methylation domain-containing protein